MITLFKGVLYQDQSPDVWQALLQLQPRVRDHAGVFGLELVLDEAEGYAYLSQRDPGESEAELPRLVQRRQLSFSRSLLLALLRKKLAEHDAAGGDTRLILSGDQIADLVQLFLPSGSNEARLMDRIDADIKNIVNLGFLRPLRGQDDQFEVRRILKAFVDAQWLSDMEERLAGYREYLAGDESAAS
ncbi:MAG: DUF4194 domain-containing protein [Gemmatimonas sp.]|nr:DUF4194 domain-containing protein [Gemmatimonas sp.]